MEDMTEVFKAEAEALRKELEKKDKEIKHLHDLLDQALKDYDELIQEQDNE